MPVLSGRINSIPFSTTSNFCFPKIPMKYSKNGQKIAMSKNTPNMFFETCWTPYKKPHVSKWSRSWYNFFWMTRYTLDRKRFVIKLWESILVDASLWWICFWSRISSRFSEMSQSWILQPISVPSFILSQYNLFTERSSKVQTVICVLERFIQPVLAREFTDLAWPLRPRFLFPSCPIEWPATWRTPDRCWGPSTNLETYGYS